MKTSNGIKMERGDLKGTLSQNCSPIRYRDEKEEKPEDNPERSDDGK